MSKEYIKWDEKYSVKIPSIDSQHKKIIDIINNLHHLLIMDKSAEKISIDQVIGELIDYATYHFDYEEKLMKDNGYEEYLDHKMEHRTFKEKIASFKDSREIDVQKVLFYLQSWLINHIMVVDMKYSSVLNK